jgi:hypothetical protein
MLSYLEARAVFPPIENQTLLILCAAIMAAMIGQGIIGPVRPLSAQSFGAGTAMSRGPDLSSPRVIFCSVARSTGVT